MALWRSPLLMGGRVFSFALAGIALPKILPHLAEMVWQSFRLDGNCLIFGPVFAFTGYLWQRVYGGKPANFLVPLLFSILIWPVAWLFWKFGENPFHQLAQRLHKRAPLTPLISPVT
jgi:hypothetical protein